MYKITLPSPRGITETCTVSINWDLLQFRDVSLGDRLMPIASNDKGVISVTASVTIGDQMSEECHLLDMLSQDTRGSLTDITVLDLYPCSLFLAEKTTIW